MSNEARTITNGRGFTSAIKLEALQANVFCICCKKEKATEVDHIISLDFGGESTAENAVALCGKCHNQKTSKEAALKEEKKIAAHVKKWHGLAFTPKGKRRTMTQATIDKNARFAKRIHRAKAKARQAKAKGNTSQALHYHKLAAKARREHAAI